MRSINKKTAGVFYNKETAIFKKQDMAKERKKKITLIRQLLWKKTKQKKNL